ncbi:27783_t:CDS:2, partial [Gigaspora margarita]
IISLDTNPDIKVEISASHMKYVSTINNNLNEIDDIMEELEGLPKKSEIDILSEGEEDKKIGVSNKSGIMWINEVVNIDFHQKFYNAFNDNFSNAIMPGDYFCCEFKAIANAQTNLFLRLDPIKPFEFSIKKFSNSYMPTVATILQLSKL